MEFHWMSRSASSWHQTVPVAWKGFSIRPGGALVHR